MNLIRIIVFMMPCLYHNALASFQDCCGKREKRKNAEPERIVNVKERDALYQQQLPTQEEQAKEQAAQSQPTATQEQNKERTPGSQSRSVRMLAEKGVKALGKKPKWSRLAGMTKQEQDEQDPGQSPKNKTRDQSETEAKKQQEGKEEDAKEKESVRRKSIIATVSAVATVAAAAKVHDGLHATRKSMSRRNMSVNTAAHRKMSSSGGEVHSA